MIRPVNGYIVISPDKIEMVNGIYTPEQIVGDVQCEGTIIAVSKEAIDDGYYTNDKIIFLQNAGHKVVFKGTEYKIIHMFDILAVIE